MQRVQLDQELQPAVTDERPISSLLDVLLVLSRRKTALAFFCMTGLFVGITVSILLPNRYTATVRIMPPQQTQSFASVMIGQLSPLLASTTAKELGVRNPNDLYISMLRSRTVEDDLIERFNLMEVYGKKLHMDARRKLENQTEITSGKDGIISVSVEDRSPQRAADMANAYSDELQKLTQRLAVTEAAKQRLFFEREVKTAGDDLAKAEDALKRTEEKTGIIQLDSQARVILEAAADLRAQVTAKEVQVQAMKSYAAAENPDLVRAERELQALRDQLARVDKNEQARSALNVPLEKVPTAAMDYVRALREVKYRETLLELMTKQYEISRVDESKDAALVQVLDAAIPAERRSWPKPSVIIMVAVLMAVFWGVVTILSFEALRRLMSKPIHSEKLHELRLSLLSPKSKAGGRR